MDELNFSFLKEEYISFFNNDISAVDIIYKYRKQCGWIKISGNIMTKEGYFVDLLIIQDLKSLERSMKINKITHKS